MYIIKWKQADKDVVALYWSEKLSLEQLDEWREKCDILQVWYPKQVSNDIVQKYGKLLTYIEYKGKWKLQTASRVVDLHKSEEEILADYTKNGRYEIRRALERDEIQFIYRDAPDNDELEAFFDYYLAFAETKHMHGLDEAKIRALAEKGELLITKAISASGEVLVMHTYICHRGVKAALMTSSSLYRNSNDKEMQAMIGRANRALHYKDMIYLKDQGFQTYDMGGLYLGEENIEQAAITRFKNGLGGEIEYFEAGFCVPFRNIRIAEDNIRRIKESVKNKKVYAWGGNAFGQYCLAKMRENGIAIEGIIDNKLALVDSGCVTSEILKEVVPSEVAIVATMSESSFDKLYIELLEKGFMLNQNIFCLRK